MKSRLGLLSPSSQKLGTLHSIGSTTSFDTTMLALKSLHLQELYSKFLSVNSQVQVQHDASAFNLLQYSGKVRQQDKDDQLRGAKLKKLENDAQLRKIQQEIENRKKKVTRHLRKELLIPQKHYMSTFQEIVQQKMTPFKQEPHTDSQDEGHGADTQRPKGLNYYNQLKKRPYLLKYTVDKVHSKEKARLQEYEARQQKISEFKSGLKIASGVIRDRSTKSQINPQKAVDGLFRRLYAKKSKETPIEQLQNDTRTNRFKLKQDELMNKIDQHSLSRDNLKKLKLKMAEIATDIYQDQKKHKSIHKFPKIALSKTINTIQL